MFEYIVYSGIVYAALSKSKDYFIYKMSTLFFINYRINKKYLCSRWGEWKNFKKKEDHTQINFFTTIYIEK